MDPKTKGERSEAKVLGRMVELGYTVLTPFGENCSYDFVVDDGEELNRIQVKTGRLREGKVIAGLSRTRFNATGSKREGYPEGSIDAYVIYCHEIESAFWVDPEDAGETQIHIRIDPPDDTHRTSRAINWADDYRL